MTPLQLTGRSSSHFTRVVRMFAHELGVPLELRPVFDMKSQAPETFAGNPALKVPSLRLRDGAVLFGTLNLCRAIAEERGVTTGLIWPEQLRSTVARNAHELVWHCMDAQVLLVLGVAVNGLPEDNAFFTKTRCGAEGALGWLDAHLAEVLAELPATRRLSLFELVLFCLLEHLSFRGPLKQAASTRPNLLRFAADFAQRPSAVATPYAFDVPPR